MKLVVLDRDGVINETRDGVISSLEDFVPIEGSYDAIARLCQHDYHIVVITNQSGIARGLVTIDEINIIHDSMQQAVASHGGRIDAILLCPHKPDDDCSCRKPRPGMLNSLMERLDIELGGVPLVGDSLRDVQTAMVVGATPVLAKTGHGTRTLEENKHLDNVDIYTDLSEFVSELLSDEDE